MSNQNRVPAGISTGGQFAAASSPESGVTLPAATSAQERDAELLQWAPPQFNGEKSVENLWGAPVKKGRNGQGYAIPPERRADAMAGFGLGREPVEAFVLDSNERTDDSWGGYSTEWVPGELFFRDADGGSIDSIELGTEAVFEAVALRATNPPDWRQVIGAARAAVAGTGGSPAVMVYTVDDPYPIRPRVLDGTEDQEDIIAVSRAAALERTPALAWSSCQVEPARDQREQMLLDLGAAAERAREFDADTLVECLDMRGQAEQWTGIAPIHRVDRHEHRSDWVNFRLADLDAERLGQLWDAGAELKFHDTDLGVRYFVQDLDHCPDDEELESLVDGVYEKCRPRPWPQHADKPEAKMMVKVMDPGRERIRQALFDARDAYRDAPWQG